MEDDEEEELSGQEGESEDTYDPVAMENATIKVRGSWFLGQATRAV